MFDFIFGMCVGVCFAIFCGNAFSKLKKFVLELVKKAKDEL